MARPTPAITSIQHADFCTGRRLQTILIGEGGSAAALFSFYFELILLAVNDVGDGGESVDGFGKFDPIFGLAVGRALVPEEDVSDGAFEDAGVEGVVVAVPRDGRGGFTGVVPLVAGLGGSLGSPHDG